MPAGLLLFVENNKDIITLYYSRLSRRDRPGPILPPRSDHPDAHGALHADQPEEQEVSCDVDANNSHALARVTGLETIINNLICFAPGNMETRGPRTVKEFGQTSFPKSSKEETMNGTSVTK